jgi:hypothetical protein
VFEDEGREEDRMDTWGTGSTVPASVCGRSGGREHDRGEIVGHFASTYITPKADCS